MKLSVFVVTYNQEQYIRQCLDSIVMQQINFDYEVIIGEDCSTDSTPQICDEYAEKFPFIKVYHHPKNLGLVKNWEFVLNRCTGEYVAMIEGDDYWTNPNKLQTQVDYLEAHTDCQICFYKPSVVFTEYVKEDQKKCDTLIFEHLRPKIYSRTEVYEKWTILTGTVMYRNPSVKYKFSSKIDIVDTFFFLSLMENGSADCIEFDGTAYRRTGTNYSADASVESYKKLYYQYNYYSSVMPDLKEISKKKAMDYLSCLIYDKNSEDTWKYRFRYMWMNKKLFFSSFFTTTILSYVIKPFTRKLCNH
jgi:glycosyltransferase involved in cell wall biosynthesis